MASSVPSRQRVIRLLVMLMGGPTRRSLVLSTLYATDPHPEAKLSADLAEIEAAGWTAIGTVERGKITTLDLIPRDKARMRAILNQEGDT